MRPAGIILSGGPASRLRGGRAAGLDPRVFDLGVPVLGICYGHQLMAQALGGEVAATGQREYGADDADASTARACCCADMHADRAGLDEPRRRGRRARPRASASGAHTDAIPIAAMEDPRARAVRRAVPPGGRRTPPHGQAVMKRFLYDGCGLLPGLDPDEHRSSERSTAIREQVGDARVLCALSRRRRLGGRRAARPPCGRRSADVRVRRSRAEPRGRARRRSRRRSAGISACRSST